MIGAVPVDEVVGVVKILGKQFCPSCGYILQKDLCGIEKIVDFNEVEEQDGLSCNPDVNYRRIEEEVINGMI